MALSDRYSSLTSRCDGMERELAHCVDVLEQYGQCAEGIDGHLAGVRGEMKGLMRPCDGVEDTQRQVNRVEVRTHTLLA